MMGSMSTSQTGCVSFDACFKSKHCSSPTLLSSHQIVSDFNVCNETKFAVDGTVQAACLC